MRCCGRGIHGSAVEWDPFPTLIPAVGGGRMTADRGDYQKVGRSLGEGSISKGRWPSRFPGPAPSLPYLRWIPPSASRELTLTTPLTDHPRSDAVAPRLLPNCLTGQHPALAYWLGALSASIRVKLMAESISGMVGMEPAPESGMASVPSRSSPPQDSSQLFGSHLDPRSYALLRQLGLRLGTGPTQLLSHESRAHSSARGPHSKH